MQRLKLFTGLFLLGLKCCALAGTYSLTWDDVNTPGFGGYEIRYGLNGSTQTNLITSVSPVRRVTFDLLPGQYYWFNVSATNSQGVPALVSSNFFCSVPLPMENASMPSPGLLQWVDRNTAPDLSGYTVYYGAPGKVNTLSLPIAQVTRTGNPGSRLVKYNVTNLLTGAYWFAVGAQVQAGLVSDVTQFVLLPPQPVTGPQLR